MVGLFEGYATHAQHVDSVAVGQREDWLWNVGASQQMEDRLAPGSAGCVAPVADKLRRCC